MQARHYTQLRHEVIELAETLGFCIGNAVKYICRAPFKGDYDGDVRKAIDYLEHLGERKPTFFDTEYELFDAFIDDLFHIDEFWLSQALYWVSRGELQRAVETLKSLQERRGKEKENATETETN